MASFKEAFAAARKAGKKSFTWNGKSYNTKVAKGNGTPDKAPVPKSKPSRLPDEAPVPTARPTGKFSGVSSDDLGSAKMPPPSAKGAGKPMTMMSKMKNSIRIGKTAVERGRRRDAAKKANKK